MNNILFAFLDYISRYNTYNAIFLGSTPDNSFFVKLFKKPLWNETPVVDGTCCRLAIVPGEKADIIFIIDGAKLVKLKATPCRASLAMSN